MKLSIQLYLAKSSFSNTVRILGTFGVERAQSASRNWVYKADLQPASRRVQITLRLTKTVIRLGDEQYWLYALLI